MKLWHEPIPNEMQSRDCRSNRKRFTKALAFERLEVRTVFDGGLLGGFHVSPLDGERHASRELARDPIAQTMSSVEIAGLRGSTGVFGSTAFIQGNPSDLSFDQDGYVRREHLQSETAARDVMDNAWGRNASKSELHNRDAALEIVGRGQTLRAEAPRGDFFLERFQSQPVRNGQIFSYYQEPAIGHHDDFFQAFGNDTLSSHDANRFDDRVNKPLSSASTLTPRESVNFNSNLSSSSLSVYQSITQALRSISETLIAQSLLKEPAWWGSVNRVSIIQVTALPRNSTIESVPISNETKSSINVGESGVIENITAQTVSNIGSNTNPFMQSHRNGSFDIQNRERMAAPMAVGLTVDGSVELSDQRLKADADEMQVKNRFDIFAIGNLLGRSDPRDCTIGDVGASEIDLHNHFSIPTPDGMVAFEFGSSVRKPQVDQAWSTRGSLGGMQRNHVSEITESRRGSHHARNTALPIPMDMELLELNDASLKSEIPQELDHYRAALAGAFPLGVLQMFVGSGNVSSDESSEPSACAQERPESSMYGEFAIAMTVGAVLVSFRWFKKKQTAILSRDLWFSTGSHFSE